MKGQLTETRVRKRLTKAALARSAGIDRGVVIRAEQGLPISDVNEQALADALEVERGFLFPSPAAEPDEAEAAV